MSWFRTPDAGVWNADAFQGFTRETSTNDGWCVFGWKDGKRLLVHKSVDLEEAEALLNLISECVNGEVL